jgi:DNA-binding MarR family transcriptional regulator
MAESRDAKPMARHLMIGWRWFDDGLRQSLREAGFGDITTAQSMVFPYLDDAGMRPTELARRLGLTRQAVQQLVAGLAAQGLVELVPDRASGRSKLVRLTRRGRRSVKVALETLDELESDLARRLGKNNADHLRNLLARAWP